MIETKRASVAFCSPIDRSNCDVTCRSSRSNYPTQNRYDPSLILQNLTSDLNKKKILSP